MGITWHYVHKSLEQDLIVCKQSVFAFIVAIIVIIIYFHFGKKVGSVLVKWIASEKINIVKGKKDLDFSGTRL